MPTNIEMVRQMADFRTTTKVRFVLVAFIFFVFSLLQSEQVSDSPKRVFPALAES